MSRKDKGISGAGFTCMFCDVFYPDEKSMTIHEYLHNNQDLNTFLSCSELSSNDLPVAESLLLQDEYKVDHSLSADTEIKFTNRAPRRIHKKLIKKVSAKQCAVSDKSLNIHNDTDTENEFSKSRQSSLGGETQRTEESRVTETSPDSGLYDDYDSPEQQKDSDPSAPETYYSEYEQISDTNFVDCVPVRHFHEINCSKLVDSADLDKSETFLDYKLDDSYYLPLQEYAKQVDYGLETNHVQSEQIPMATYEEHVAKSSFSKVYKQKPVAKVLPMRHLDVRKQVFM